MNPCTRCGKERITVKTRKERVGDSVVIYSETACPDQECQSIVDKQLEKEKAQRERLISMNQNLFTPGGGKKKI